MGARIGGLIIIGAGLLLFFVVLGIHFLVATFVSATLGLPVACIGFTPSVIVMFGEWLQFLFGVPFNELNAQFSTAPPLKKVGLGIVYAISSLVFLIGFISFLTWL